MTHFSPVVKGPISYKGQAAIQRDIANLKAGLAAAGITEGGAPTYCAHLPTTDATIWSLYPGEISSPTATAGPNDEVYPSETESPVLVCMEQTGQSHVDCHDDILQSNATATATPPS